MKDGKMNYSGKQKEDITIIDISLQSHESTMYDFIIITLEF